MLLEKSKIRRIIKGETLDTSGDLLKWYPLVEQFHLATDKVRQPKYDLVPQIAATTTSQQTQPHTPFYFNEQLLYEMRTQS